MQFGQWKLCKKDKLPQTVLDNISKIELMGPLKVVTMKVKEMVNDISLPYLPVSWGKL